MTEGPGNGDRTGPRPGSSDPAAEGEDRPGTGHGPETADPAAASIAPETADPAAASIAPETAATPGQSPDDESFWQRGVPYRELIEQVSDYAIFCTDATGHAKTWNLGVERLLGFTEHEFVGCDIAKAIFLDEDSAAGVPEWEMQQAAREGSASDNRWMKKKSGERFFCIGMTTALRDDGGRLIGYAKVMQDRTSQHEQAEALRETTTRLALANEQKDRFLAVLSHELRNPLAPIRNAVELLRIAPAGSEAATRAIDAIDRQSVHLKRLVDDLLDISRIGRGKIGLEVEDVELNAFLERIGADYREAFERNDILFTVEPFHDLLHVHADRVRLVQIVGNLLDNARKFTPPGGSVALRSAPSDGEALIEIADTGAGMTPDVIAKVFEPFVQSETTIERSLGGLGLGLSLVKGLVEMHGGRIEARSAGPGQGTNLRVHLPLRDAGGEAVLPERVAEPSSVPRRVLIVEDDADAADMLSTALIMRGHRVRTAKSGRQAFEIVAEFHPEVVVCNLGLPDIDGYAVARRLRADPATASIRLIALSGYAMPGDVEKTEQAGFDRHVAKPPDIDALHDVISSAE